MTKEEIYNNYAIEKGYKNWSAILFQFQDDFNYDSPEDENNVMNWIEYHINAVTDLIQEELIKKLHNEYAENNNKDWYDYTNQNKSALILNTENIK